MAIGTTAAILGAAAIGGGTALAGGAMQSRAASRSADAVRDASDQSSATQRYIFDTIRGDTATQRAAGNAATSQIARLMNLNIGGVAQQPASQQPAQQPQVLPQQPANALQGRQINPQGNPPPWKTTRDGIEMMFGGGNALTPTPAVGGTATTPQANPAQPASPYDPTAWLRATPGYQFNYDEGMRGLNAGLASRGQLFSGDAGREAIRYGQNYGDRIYNQERNALFNLAGMGQVSQGQTNAAGQNYANNQTSLNMGTANALGSSYQNSANAWTNALGGIAGAGMWGLNQLR